MNYENHPNDEMNQFVEQYLDRQYGTYSNEDMEFPNDYELDNLYHNMHSEYMSMNGTQAYISQPFNNLLWFALIGSLYRRFPYYRGRCRYDRRYCRGRRGYPGGGYGRYPGFSGW